DREMFFHPGDHRRGGPPGGPPGGPNKGHLGGGFNKEPFGGGPREGGPRDDGPHGPKHPDGPKHDGPRHNDGPRSSEFIQERFKAAFEKIDEVLTPEQRTLWHEMTGPPYTGPISLPGRERGRPRP